MPISGQNGGKTLIFADRWYKCEYLREDLKSRGVRVDAVYNYVAASLGGPEERNRRTQGDNAKALAAFKNGELDVLINVKMLTEGTDVPDVHTVFLTRQTTSRILMTQMIGRALRGPKFGGTAEAQIVVFIDDWKQRIHFAEYDQLGAASADEELRELRKHPPVHLVSIELVRSLSRQMDSGTNINSMPYRQYLPVGWYVAEYRTRVADTDDDEPIVQQIIVFEHRAAKFVELLKELGTLNLAGWSEYDLPIESVQDLLDGWQSSYFASGEDTIGADLNRDLFALARHMAQNEGRFPRYIPFDAHKSHDLDALAREHYDADLGVSQIAPRLIKEYARKDRQWNAFYPNFATFKSAYDGCMNRIALLLSEKANSGKNIGVSNPETTPDREPTDDLKRQIKIRDGRRCLCCGETSPLQVDHIDSFYSGGSNVPENLQTLCKYCNRIKDTAKIDFRISKSPLKEPLRAIPNCLFPADGQLREPHQWKIFVRACFNLFYRAAAVDEIEIGQRGYRLHNWIVTLNPGNNPEWLKPYINYFVERIRDCRKDAGLTPAPKEITVLEKTE